MTWRGFRWVVTILLGLGIAWSYGCANRIEAVYHDEQGFNHLLVCEKETTPNDREILFCHLDEERGVW